MKRLFQIAFIASLALLAISMPEARAEGVLTEAVRRETSVDKKWTTVATAEEFVRAFKQKQNIRLVADIDMAGVDMNMNVQDSNPIDFKQAEITGMKDSYHRSESPYFAIKNMEEHSLIVENLKVHHLVFSGSKGKMFFVTYNCTFNELIFEKCNLSEDNKFSSSLITDLAHDCEFTNIMILGCTIFNSSQDQGGFLCNGLLRGRIENCYLTSSCMIYSADGHVGSLVGDAHSVTIKHCTSYATVVGNEDVCGGMVGKAEMCIIDDCHFYGVVKHEDMNESTFQTFIDKYAGLMYGGVQAGKNVISIIYSIPVSLHQLYTLYATDLATMLEAFSEVNGPDINQLIIPAIGYFVEDAAKLFQLVWDVNACMTAWSIIGLGCTIFDIAYSASGHDEVGGIVGASDGSDISGCSNYGFVRSFDAYAGGIVGYANSTRIKSCLNHGVVRGDEQTGGIAGYMGGGSISTSLNIGNVSCHTLSTAGRICGDKQGDVVLSYNCYSGGDSELDGSQTQELSVSQLDMVSGTVTAFLDQKSGDDRWHQTVGKNYWPTLNPKQDKVTRDKIDRTLSTVIKVGEPISLMCAMVDPCSDIFITDDIDLCGYPLFNLSSSFMPFRGRIRGNGHRISNITHMETNKKYGFFGLASLFEEVVNTGMFGYAEDAHFSDLELHNIRLEIATNIENVSLFVANSKGCTYENIRITGDSYIKETDEKRHYAWNIGGIVGKSTSDTIINCAIGPNCLLYAYDGRSDALNMGGIVGYGSGTKVISSWNASHILGTHSGVCGGIMGLAENCRIEQSLNTGKVSGLHETGGIAGRTNAACVIDNCECNGDVEAVPMVDSGIAYRSPAVSGIIGAAHDATVTNCLLFGIMANDKTYSPIVGQSQKSVSPKNLSNCYWHIQNIDKTQTHLPTGLGSGDILTGRLAMQLNALGQGQWYQDIDNNTFDNHYPAPLKSAGEIYENTVCIGSDKVLSNRYHCQIAHTPSIDKFGLCLLCGAICPTPPSITIDRAEDLSALIYATNRGQDFASSTITMTQDIDMRNIPFAPIGNRSHPFSGTFDGGGHRLKNVICERGKVKNGGFGLFAAVSGTTTIRDLILDKSCCLMANTSGVGGIVGNMEADAKLTLTRCGNEASVTGANFVGGLIGLTGASAEPVRIEKCFNTGAIRALDTDNASASSIAGLIHTAYIAHNTWNTGTITNRWKDKPFIMGMEEDSNSLVSCWDVNPQTSVTQIRAEDASTGRLCHQLNNGVDGSNSTESWYQKVGEEAHPTFLHHEGDLVYKHVFKYCETPNITETEYDNSSAVVPDIVHTYDEDGFCHRAEGVEHYEPASLEENEWKVSKMANLYWVAQEVNSGAEQHDISLQCDLTDNKNVIVDGALNANTAIFRKWTPIGISTYGFEKTFEGNNHTVSGLYFNEGMYAGLMEYVIGEAKVSNVGVIDSYFKASFAGGIAACAGGTGRDSSIPRIDHCYSSALITGTSVAGGIVAYYVLENSIGAAQPTVSDCYSTSRLISPETPKYYLGGIIGKSENVSNIGGCYYLEDSNIEESALGEKAKSESAFKLGEVAMLMNESSNGWTQDISTDAVPKFGNGGVKYTRTVTPGNWASLVLPCKVASTDDVQLYTFGSMNVNNHILTLIPVESVPANTPCFFKTKGECTTASFAFIENGYVAPAKVQFNIEKQLSENVTLYLHGTYEDTVVNPEGNPEVFANYFVAQNQLWWGEEAFTLPAFRGYISIFDVFGNYAPAKAISLMLDEDSETTQIGEIRDGELNMFGDGKYLENGRIVIKKNNKNYNINGQKIK